MNKPGVSRGNVLLITMVALAVLMVLVMGAIRFTGTNRVSAASKLGADRLAACAEAAKFAVLENLAKGTSMTDLKIQSTLMDDATPARRTKFISSHYDDTVKVTAVPLPGDTFSDTGGTGVANKILAAGGGRAYFKTVMLCGEPDPRETDPLNPVYPPVRQAEIEFLFRFGR